MESLIRVAVAEGHIALAPGISSTDFCVLRVGGLRISVQVSRERMDEEIILTPRESEIARLIAAGNPDKTIAAALQISKFTVSTYIRRIFAKLGVSTRAAMVHRLKNHWQ
jgi:DNA-binding CsgD family transcriptional regulator